MLCESYTFGLKVAVVTCTASVFFNMLVMQAKVEISVNIFKKNPEEESTTKEDSKS